MGYGASALEEILGRNQGPTKLEYCFIDYSVLANGLRGNSRLKSFSPTLFNVLAIAGALKENKGLVDLDLKEASTMSDETWDAVYDSLKTHPTLEVLDLRKNPSSSIRATLAPDVITSRIQTLLKMMKVNMTIHTIHLASHFSENELLRESVIPYREMNRFRPRLLAIQKARPIMYRTRVLGRALLAVRTNPNRFWMLLPGNAEVVFPSTTATTTPAANLPTPATASVIAATVVVLLILLLLMLHLLLVRSAKRVLNCNQGL
jgi:hypothetical protein